MKHKSYPKMKKIFIVQETDEETKGQGRAFGSFKRSSPYQNSYNQVMVCSITLGWGTKFEIIFELN